MPAWADELEVGVADSVFVLGAEQNGVTFALHGGIARSVFFGFVVTRGDARSLIAIGVGGRDNVPVSIEAARALSWRVSNSTEPGWVTLGECPVGWSR